jgi:hypothetical protein
MIMQKTWDMTTFLSHLSATYKTARDKTRKVTTMATATIVVVVVAVIMTMCH